MEEKKPLVSIVVRTKDRPKLLNNAIKSLAEQTYRHIEVVLVNDGGCDLNIEELKNVLGDIPLNYVRLEKNTGRSHAGNVGIENAKGDYIGFLDDDDELYPEHVSTHISFSEQNDCNITYSLSEEIETTFDNEKKKFTKVKSNELTIPRNFSRDLLLVENYIPFNSLIIKMKALSEVGHLDEELELYEDWDLLTRLSDKYPFCFINKTTSKYIHWDSNEQITAKTGLAVEPYLKVLSKNFNKIKPEVYYNLYLLNHERRERITRLVELVESKGYTELNKAINTKDQAIKDLECKMQVIEEENKSLNVALNTIYQTFGWKILNKFYGLRDSVLPHSTMRGKIYTLFIKSLKTFFEEGGTNLIRKARRRLKKEYLFKGLIQAERLNNIGTFKLDNRCHKSPIDIIIPVYNGVELLMDCLDSVLKNTDMTFNNLIIIDDDSIDPEVKEVLRSIIKDGKNISIISNCTNLGFVKTVNIGLRMSDDNDVIILNSDTVVTRRWVDKLKSAAYSEPNVATVTPFSNNATICSIPNFLENNRILPDFNVQSFGEFIENISLRYYPDIPTAVGFCMYIKRAVIKEVGIFDEKNFGRGYGEENDFCMRAMKRGYKHILDDSTFIYHKGGESFTMPEKTKLEQMAIEMMDDMHPEYLPMVYKFIDKNPLKPIHEYINFRLNILKNDKNIICSS